MRPLLLLAATLALAGCAAHDPPTATVHAMAAFDVEGAWDMARAEQAATTMGFAVSDRGASGFVTELRDGESLFAADSDPDDPSFDLAIGYRFDDADVCSAASYDAWVDALLAKLEPQAASRAAAFAAATGGSVGAATWEVTAANARGELLAFPDHCGTLHACVGGDDCAKGSRWQDAPAGR